MNDLAGFAHEIANNSLGLNFSVDDTMCISMTMFGRKWRFDNKTQAEAIEEAYKIFWIISDHMEQIVNDKIKFWATLNKPNFN